MMLYSIGISIIAALFRKDTEVKTPESKPVYTYEQACKYHLQKFNDLCCKFHPVYFYRDKQYYQLIDEYTCIEVDTDTEFKGISKLPSDLSKEFFNHAMHQRLREQGFEETNQHEFHFHFSKVQHEINLSVNGALNSK